MPHRPRAHAAGRAPSSSAQPRDALRPLSTAPRPLRIAAPRVMFLVCPIPSLPVGFPPSGLHPWPLSWSAVLFRAANGLPKVCERTAL